MPFNEELAGRVRFALSALPDVEEKKMFRGLTFMVDGKMCVSISEDRIMCRIDPDLSDEIVEKNDCRIMKMKGREYKGFILVDETQLITKEDLDYWINLSLDFNKRAKASVKKKKSGRE